VIRADAKQFIYDIAVKLTCYNYVWLSVNLEWLLVVHMELWKC
jgi:hypothetical protein